MPLVSPLLQRAIADLFRSQLSSPEEFAQKFAKAYDDYAKGAMAIPASPVFTGSEKTLLESAVKPALITPFSGAPPIIAAAITAGYVSYWSAPPVNFACPLYAGMVVAPAGAAALLPALTAVFLNTQNTEDSAAQQIASALDAATRLVMVLLIPIIPPQPPGSPPITVPLV